MQDTLALQEEEVRQYTIDESAAQASARQRQRDDLEFNRPSQASYTQRSEYGGMTPDNTGRGTYGSTTVHSTPQSGNAPSHVGPNYNRSRLPQSPHIHLSTTNAPTAGSYTPHTADVDEHRNERSYMDNPREHRNVYPARDVVSHHDDMTQRRGISTPPSSVDTMNLDALPSAQPLYQTSSDFPGRRRWICSRCQHRNDPATHPGQCDACNTSGR